MGRLGRTGGGATRRSPALRFCNPRQNRFFKGSQANRPADLFSFRTREVAGHESRGRPRPPAREVRPARGSEADASWGGFWMTLKPNEREFEELAAKGFNLIPVFHEIAADLETPVSAYLKVARGDYSFLLESVRGGEKCGRYTFLGSEPGTVVRGRDSRMDLIRPRGGVGTPRVEQSLREPRRAAGQ